MPPERLNCTERERRAVFISTKYETAHPVVRVHPLTGERGLFIGGFAQRIVGFSTGESRDLLRLLQAYVTRPENVLRVSWEPGQLVLFDNRITQHYAIDNYDDLPRRLNRVTVARTDSLPGGSGRGADGGDRGVVRGVALDGVALPAVDADGDVSGHGDAVQPPGRVVVVVDRVVLGNPVVEQDKLARLPGDPQDVLRPASTAGRATPSRETPPTTPRSPPSAPRPEPSGAVA